eukprot:Clim_evm12s2 gene=Clim_evmTU12s2
MEAYDAVGLGNAQPEPVVPFHQRRQPDLDIGNGTPTVPDEPPELGAQGGLSSVTLPEEAKVNSQPLITVRHDMPDGWTDLGEVEDEETEEVKVIFVLKHQNVAKMKKMLVDVSDPDSPKYQQYLTVNEVADLVRPQQAHIDAVETFTKGFNCNSVSKTIADDLITVTMPVGEAKRAFNAKFHYYSPDHAPDTKIIRTLGYNVPDEIAEALDDISGLLLLGYKPMTVQRVGTEDDGGEPSDKPGPSNPVTPHVITSAYGINPTVPKKASQAIASFFDLQNNEYFSPADLAQFQKLYSLPNNPIARTIDGNDPNSPQLEATLDVQYITSSCQGCETWQFFGNNFFNLMDWATQVLETDDSPLVHSMSYGWPERLTKKVENVYATNQQFIKLGLTGRTLLVASGDTGVGCNKHKHDPGYPGSSPYVTSVGGTDGLTEGWTASGGGFSTLFEAPAHQISWVDRYFDVSRDTLPPPKQYNAYGRAFPDISALSTYYSLVYGGEAGVLVSGTSCSTPTVAGIITLLNDVSLANGGGPLGYLNPLLYKMKAAWPDAFTDISSGNNSFINCKGFDAHGGWNPVTGLGTPNYVEMAKYVANNAKKVARRAARNADLHF